MHLTPLDYGLWLGNFLVVLAILVTMSKRRLQRAYPYFFVYILLQAVGFSLLFALRTVSYRAYYYAYFAFLIFSIVASVAVFWDILRSAFAPFQQFRDLTVLMFWSSIALILAAMILINYGRSQSDAFLLRWMLSAESATRVAQCALVLLLFCFRKLLKISVGNMAFGIALGFGLFAVTNMLMTGLAGIAGPSRAVLNHVRGSAYLTASLIWLAYAIRSSARLRVPGQADAFA